MAPVNPPPVNPAKPDERAEGLFQAWNLRYELVDQFPIADILTVSEQQARAAIHRALKENVEVYFQQMSGGAVFPPIVLREPNILLDGNTRLAAANRLGMVTFPAYIVHDISTVQLARALSGSLNQLGGQRLTADEAQEIAVEMLYGQMKLPVGEVAKYVGRSAAQITKWRKQADAAQHAERLGIGEALAALPSASRDKLAAVQLDEPFRKLVEVVGESKPPQGELTTLINDIDKSTSEADAIGLIEIAARDWRPVGPTRQVVRNDAAKRARMVVPQILNLPAGELYDAARVDEDLVMWERLRDHVTAILMSFAEHNGEGNAHLLGVVE